MIELGTIAILGQFSVVEVRNKIYRLALALRFDELGAVRLASVASEIARELNRLAGEPSIRLGIATEGVCSLVVCFESRHPLGSEARMGCFFESVGRTQMNDGMWVSTGTKRLSDPRFRPDSQFVEEQRRRIRHASREALLMELRTANERLERTVEERTADLRRAMDEVHANEQRYRFLAERPGQIVYDCDLRTGTIRWSGDLEGVTGRMADEFSEVDHGAWEAMVHPDDREAASAQFQRALAEGGECVTEYRLRRADGVYLFAEDNGLFLRDERGEAHRMLGLIRDISERKQAEEELHRAREVAEAATRAKSDFLANMSHEIRTPMNAVIGMAHLALKTELTPKQRDYLKKIQSSADALLGIINDILDVSKIEAGRLEIETVDYRLDDVLESVSNVIGQRAHDKGLELVFNIGPDVSPALVGDPLRLGQVLINLGTNAVKFTEAGEVVFDCACLEEHAGRVKLQFSVRDTGIGMTREQADGLFEAFTQADTSTTRKYGGTGLGLSICKRLVELMDGQIGIESELGKGSEFRFTVWQGMATEERSTVRTISPDLRDMRVLVVDDNETARQVLGEALESLRFHVRTVASADEAVSELERDGETDPYQLVLMDWRMPGMDGVEATEHIKQDLSLPHVPAVIMVTAYGREDVREQAEKAGADGFLLKPINRSLLLDAIQNVLATEEVGASAIQGAQESESGVERAVRGLRVLVVEDNEINQQVALGLLESVGVDVTVACNGREAVRVLLERQPPPRFDAVLMDLQMPEMDGFEATLRIRSAYQYAHLPIIAMTAHALVEERDRCLAAGMNDHVTKPIDPQALFAALARWTTESQCLDEAPPEPKCPEQSLPNIPGVDIRDGLRRVGGNNELYFRLLRKFAEDQGDVANSIRAALANSDLTLAGRLAHTIKGAAGNLGVQMLPERAGVLESLIHDGGAEKVERALSALAQEMGRVVGDIRRELTQTRKQASSKTTVDPEALSPLLFKLRSLLVDSDADAVEYLDQIRGQLLVGPVAEKTERLERLVTDFDFEQALSCLDDLAASFQISL